MEVLNWEREQMVEILNTVWYTIVSADTTLVVLLFLLVIAGLYYYFTKPRD